MFEPKDPIVKKEKLIFDDLELASFDNSEGFMNVENIRGYIVDDKENTYFLNSFKMDEDENFVIDYMIQGSDSEILFIQIVVSQMEEVSWKKL